MARVNINERDFIIKITNFDTGHILNGLLRQVGISKNLRSSGTESRVHANDLLLYFITAYRTLGIHNGKR